VAQCRIGDTLSLANKNQIRDNHVISIE